MNTDKIYAEQIANQYSKKEATKVKQLKRLDAKAKNPARIFGYSFGTFSALVFGTGMSLAMGVLTSGIGAMIAGIVVGIVGMAGCLVNYPIYKAILKKGKEKYGSDIIRLANEISESEQD